MKKRNIFIILPLIEALSCCKPVSPTQESEEIDKDLEELVSYAGTINIDFGNDLEEPIITGSVDNVFIENSGAYITVTSTKDGVVKYILSGRTTKGGFKIYSSSRFALVLNGVDISTQDSCAINIQSSKRTYLVLQKGSTNSIIDGNNYPIDKEDTGSGGEDKKGAIFSEGQIIVSGSGTLNIKGRNNHAFASDEYIRVRSGNIIIESAIKDGIHAKDYYLQNGGDISINCSKDGIQITKGYGNIVGGNLYIKATKGNGIIADYGIDITDIDPEIKANVYLNGGTTTIEAPASGKNGIYGFDKVVINSGVNHITCYKVENCIATSPTGVTKINGGSNTFDEVESPQ